MASLNFERLLSTKVRRRQVLIGAGGLTGLAIATQLPTRAIAQPKFSDYPFKLGVASGEPYPDSVVLWTRLAPDPLNGGGMPAANVPVQWQIADDENMRRIISSGTVMATTELGHSVHVEAQGLRRLPTNRLPGELRCSYAVENQGARLWVFPQMSISSIAPKLKTCD